MDDEESSEEVTVIKYVPGQPFICNEGGCGFKGNAVQMDRHVKQKHGTNDAERERIRQNANAASRKCSRREGSKVNRKKRDWDVKWGEKNMGEICPPVKYRLGEHLEESPFFVEIKKGEALSQSGKDYVMKNQDMFARKYQSDGEAIYELTFNAMNEYADTLRSGVMRRAEETEKVRFTQDDFTINERHRRQFESKVAALQNGNDHAYAMSTKAVCGQCADPKVDCNKDEFKWGNETRSSEEVCEEIREDLLECCKKENLEDTTDKDDWMKRFEEFRDDRIKSWLEGKKKSCHQQRWRGPGHRQRWRGRGQRQRQQSWRR